MRLKLSVVAAGLAIAVMSGWAVSAKVPETLRIATDGESPPYSVAKPDGSVEGFEIDLAKILCEKVGVKCTVEVQNFDGMIPALTAGKFDVIMASMSITEKRKKVIDFSLPYGGTGNTMAAIKGGSLDGLPGLGTKLSLEDPGAADIIAKMAEMLKGKKIGVESGSVSADFAKEKFGSVAEVHEYKKSDEINLDLVAGRIDAELNGRSFIFNSTKQPENKDMVMVGPVFDEGVFGLGVGFGLRKEDADLTAKINDAIKATVAEGKLKELSMKWFGFDITPVSLRK